MIDTAQDGSVAAFCQITGLLLQGCGLGFDLLPSLHTLVVRGGILWEWARTILVECLNLHIVVPRSFH